MSFIFLILSTFIEKKKRFFIVFFITCLQLMQILALFLHFGLIYDLAPLREIADSTKTYEADGDENDTLTYLHS